MSLRNSNKDNWSGIRYGKYRLLVNAKNKKIVDSKSAARLKTNTTDQVEEMSRSESFQQLTPQAKKTEQYVKNDDTVNALQIKNSARSSKSEVFGKIQENQEQYLDTWKQGLQSESLVQNGINSNNNNHQNNAASTTNPAAAIAAKNGRVLQLGYSQSLKLLREEQQQPLTYSAASMIRQSTESQNTKAINKRVMRIKMLLENDKRQQSNTLQRSQLRSSQLQENYEADEQEEQQYQSKIKEFFQTPDKYFIKFLEHVPLKPKLQAHNLSKSSALLQQTPQIFAHTQFYQQINSTPQAGSAVHQYRPLSIDYKFRKHMRPQITSLQEKMLSLSERLFANMLQKKKNQQMQYAKTSSNFFTETSQNKQKSILKPFTPLHVGAHTMQGFFTQDQKPQTATTRVRFNSNVATMPDEPLQNED